MSFFLPALICVLGWGAADLFYKFSTDENDRYSHLRISVWVGIVMGAVSILLLLTAKETRSVSEIFRQAVRYSPASLSYIISMVIGYAGLRYLELSVVSPVQNASGALSAVCMLVYFTLTGRITKISEEFSVLDLLGTFFITGGFIALAFIEQKLARQEQAESSQTRKYRYGALALVFPLLYCVFDTVGTAADGILLDGAGGMNLSETDVLILYGLTFFAFGIAAFLYLRLREKNWYNPFAKTELPKAAAASAEEFGQVFYVFAMAKSPVLAAPMVASYCIVSLILSRVFLKEKLKKSQYICIFFVVAGIVLLGVAEGLAER